jgi:hypothetical protein
MEITKKSDPPPRRRADYTPIYEALGDMAVGEWMSVKFDTDQERKNARGAVRIGANRRGIQVTIEARQQTLYIRRNK